MDNFFFQFFSDSDPSEDTPFLERPEIQDAIARILACRPMVSLYNVTASEPRSTRNASVQRLEVTIQFRSKVQVLLAPVDVWVDGFELAFHFRRWVDTTPGL